MAQTLTNGSIQNSTDQAITYVISHDWQGKNGARKSDRYPDQVAAKALHKFNHVGNENGSQGAVVYRVKNTAGKSYDVGVAWFNPPDYGNKIYTSVEADGHFTTAVWPEIFTKLIDSTDHDDATCGGITSNVAIGNGNNTEFSAKITYTTTN